MKRLKEKLEAIEGKPYGAYKSIKGLYTFPDFQLALEHVQGDPFAAPSQLSARVPLDQTGFPSPWTDDARARVALGDFISRRLSMAFQALSDGRGTGRSGELRLPRPGQQILPRSSVLFTGEHLVVRFTAGLPADGRRILASEAISLLLEKVPYAVSDCAILREGWADAARDHITLYRRQEELREKLQERGLVAFVADGARLPRASGTTELPENSPDIVPFSSPDSLRVAFELSDGFRLEGMGIPQGVTLVVGGGFQGKSTLLQALQRGIYSHQKGDGREFVITVRDAVKIRAEDGRHVPGLDISPFIRSLPQGYDPVRFSTANASGSTSQAAGILEAVESGAGMLLMDEDTCASNFMIRDEKMAALISDEEEPIIPFVRRVKGLYSERGISTVLVMGGSGDYFDRADLVIAMKQYRPSDVTAQARAIAGRYAKQTNEAPAEGTESSPIFTSGSRRIQALPKQSDRKMKLKVNRLDSLKVGDSEVDMRTCEQLVCSEQMWTLSHFIHRVFEEGAGVDPQSLRQWSEGLWQGEFRQGLPARCDLAAVRHVDLMAALFRLPELKLKMDFDKNPLGLLEYEDGR